MKYTDILHRKMRGDPLTRDDIYYAVNAYLRREITDYQFSPLLTAIFIHGMTIDEIASLTDVMLKSGAVLDTSDCVYPTVDKHSTGGIGDKISLILVPLLATFDLAIYKMSGQGLGVTGGTIDKLSSISGYRCEYTIEELKQHMRHTNLAIISQSDELVPADKEIYSLRNSTSLVNSIPLIASSIMSKKLASGAQNIILDVKYGSGAFMSTPEEAHELARIMVDIGRHFDRNVVAYITSMETPLGSAIGNRVEILEAYDYLHSGRIDPELHTVCITLAIQALIMTGLYSDAEHAAAAINDRISSGAALAKFHELVTQQGGSIEHIKSSSFWTPHYSYTETAQKSGIFHINSASVIGEVALELGAGRRVKSDIIDYDAGVIYHARNNTQVAQGDKLYSLYSNSPISPAVIKLAASAHTIDNVTRDTPVIFARVD